MILYFTGAKKEGQHQPEPRLSLGGHVSGSLIPNASLNNLFGEISQYTLQKQNTEYRAIAVRNTTGGTIAASQLYYENLSISPLVNIKMAVVVLAQDTCGLYMESISNAFAKPLAATFVDNRGVDNAITLPPIEDGHYLGIWIERSFNVNAVASSQSCASLIAAYIQESVEQVSTITTIADASDSLHEKYWFFDTPQNRFFIWYDTGGGEMPSVPNREPIRVGIVTDDNADDVALKTKNQLSSILEPRGESTVTVLANVITLTNIQPGSAPSPTAETSGFTALVITQGSSNGLETEEDIALTISW